MELILVGSTHWSFNTHIKKLKLPKSFVIAGRGPVFESEVLKQQNVINISIKSQSNKI